MTPERWQRVNEIFHSAAERDPDRRAAFLEEACASDPPLRAEVESLLASDEHAAGFLQVPAVKVESLSLAGKQVGPYRIVREIGRGGMGAVYLAIRADDEYEKRVAIKLIKRGMDTDSVIRRFRNERQILANLDHPNIAKLLDGGTTDDGLPYFVMDYIEGFPIDDYCAARKLSVDERLELFRTVCAAVGYAHRNQVVHRDLKPGNILVTAEGAPKLLDFGIAKLLRSELSSQSPESTIGLRPMTPEYASPEQVRGGTLTPASDIYSLGVLLYTLLSGHHPLRLQDRTSSEIEQAICNQEPEPPSVAARRDNNERSRKLAGDLDSIVLRAIRKEPERRYDTVEQFSEDLRCYLEALPVMARRDSVWYGAKFLKRRGRVAFVAALLAAAVLAAFRAGIPGWPARNLAAGSVAVLPLKNLGGDAGQEYFADGITETLINDLAQIAALRVSSRTSVMQYKEVRKPLRQIARELGVDAVVEGSVLRSGDRVRITAQLVHASRDQHLWAKSYERDLRDVLTLQNEVAAAIAKEIQIKLTPREHVRLARVQPIVREAQDAYLKGRFFWNKRGHEDLRKAIDYFQQAIEKDPGYASAYSGLADCYTALPFNADARPKEYFPKARVAAAKAIEIDGSLAEAHVSLAYTLHYYDWDWQGAEREYRRAIELNPSYAVGHQWYAAFLSAMGRHAEAIAEAQRSQELEPLTPIIHALSGRCFFHARQYDRAIEQYRKAFEIDPNFEVAHLFASKALEQKGMYSEALAELRKAEGIPETRSAVGHVYAMWGRTGQARQVIDELEALSKKRYVPPYELVRVYAGLGERDAAFAWLEKAFEERDNRLAVLNVEPVLDKLRSDERYPSFVRRLGLPALQ